MKRILKSLYIILLLFVLSSCGKTTMKDVTEDTPLYNVSFVVDGEIYDSQVVAKGNRISRPTTPIKEGYAFTWWEDDNGVKWDFINSTVDSTLVLNAKFKANTYTITLYESNRKIVAEYGDVITLPTLNNTEEEKFVGWTDENGNLVETYEVKSSATFYECWEKRIYINYIFNGGNTYKQEVMPGEEIVLLETKSTDNTHEFVGWIYEDELIDSNYEFNLTDSITLKAFYQRTIDYTISYYNGYLVEGPLTLPKYYRDNGEIKILTWRTSQDCVYYVDNALKNGYLLAYFIYPSQETQVTFSTTVNGSLKTFSVTVRAIEIGDFAYAYDFPQNDVYYQKNVYENFTLDREFEYQGRTATIDWSISDEYKDVIELSDDGNLCIVHPTNVSSFVKINATFTYNGEELSIDYSFCVKYDDDPAVNVKAWYTYDTYISFDGYVVAIAKPYDATYNCYCLYAISEDLSYGFYLHNVYCDNKEAKKIVPGAHISAIHVKKYECNRYDHLHITNGSICIKDNQSLSDIYSTIYSLDEDLFANSPSATYHQSTLVSLSKWQIVDTNAKTEYYDGLTVLKIRKNDVTVRLVISKYIEGEYTYNGVDPVLNSIHAKSKTFKVGDYVDVYGIYRYYEGSEIILLSPDCIVKSEAEEENTVHPGVAVGDAINIVREKLDEYHLDKIIGKEKTLNLPTTYENVSITYGLMYITDAITIDGGTIRIIPDVYDISYISITYTCGNYTTKDFFFLVFKAYSPKQRAEYEYAAYTSVLIQGVRPGFVELSSIGSTFDDVEIIYEPSDDYSRELMEIVDGGIIFKEVSDFTSVYCNIIFRIEWDDQVYEIVRINQEIPLSPKIN